MPSVNPGPAALITSQTEAALVPQNSGTSLNLPAGLAALRLLAVIRGLNLNGLGDLAVLQVNNATNYAVQAILVGNAVGGTAATGNITLNTGPAVTGTQFRAAGVLAGVTGPTTVVAQTVTSGGVINTSQLIYINATVAVASAVDIYVYGYDLSPYSP